MDIIWHGFSCFTIKSKNGTIVTDPYSPEVGLKLPALKADIVVTSRKQKAHNNVAAIQGSTQIITWPGEYEIKGVAISAQKLVQEEEKKKAGKEVMVFTFDVEGVRICLLGDIGKGLDESLIESIGNVDILLIPVGGNDTLDAKTAHAVVEELEPRAVIPMHFAIPGMKEKYDDVAPFMKLCGATAEPKDKFSINAKSDLPSEQTSYVVLTPQTA